MEQTVQALRDRCRIEVLAAHDHVLTFASRRALLHALGPLVVDNQGYGRELTLGKKRRMYLAWMCASKVAPTWELAFQSQAVARLLAYLVARLEGRLGADVLERAADSFQATLEQDPRGMNEGELAGRAATAAAWVGVGDELLLPDAGCTQPQLDCPEDPSLWDAAYFAACSFSGGIPGSPRFSKERMREFWLEYLDSAVPTTCDRIGLPRELRESELLAGASTGTRRKS